MKLTKLHYYDPYFEEYDCSNDIDRILNILKDRGFTTTRQEAYYAWSSYSDKYAASWLNLPELDDDVFFSIMEFLDVQLQTN